MDYSVTPLKLQKILYYQQAWHIALLSEDGDHLQTLFEDQPQAWVNGPVYQKVYYAYKDYVEYVTENLPQSAFCTQEQFNKFMETMNLTEDEKSLYNSVITLYGSKSQNELVLMTHMEQPWAEQRAQLQPYERSNNPISFKSMFEYYKKRHDQNRKNS